MARFEKYTTHSASAILFHNSREFPEGFIILYLLAKIGRNRVLPTGTASPASFFFSDKKRERLRSKEPFPSYSVSSHISAGLSHAASAGTAAHKLVGDFVGFLAVYDDCAAVLFGCSVIVKRGLGVD